MEATREAMIVSYENRDGFFFTRRRGNNLLLLFFFFFSLPAAAGFLDNFIGACDAAGLLLILFSFHSE